MAPLDSPSGVVDLTPHGGFCERIDLPYDFLGKTKYNIFPKNG